MARFNVVVYLDQQVEGVNERQQSLLVSALARYHVVTGGADDSRGGQARMYVHIDIEAADFGTALDAATALVYLATRRAGLGEPAIVGIEILTEAEFAAREGFDLPDERIAVDEAAQLRRVSTSAIRQHARAGRWGAQKVGGEWTFNRKAFEAELPRGNNSQAVGA